ncbi:tumor necrosis factor receptor superfamily member 23-like [Cavia porcellus]|uniref:tumor necrosis factor receptor superfamily member 23-like n=1 Tax=Cavia porcellus TaxID=10141 RepID=UPI000661E7B6|nr:tumor necrosis factor receptor superfamily member 23-like [Cavia porcellus]
MVGPSAEHCPVPKGWTLLRALCLFVLLEQVLTTLQYSGLESCNSDEYMNAGRCCKMCPAGQYVEKPCMRPHTQGVCVKCEPGTYTAYANGLESCLLCSTCRADQEVVRKCSPTNDQKCECKQGYFSEDTGCLEHCTPCDKCPDETAVLRECNATSNTVCRAAHSVLEKRNRLYTFLCIIPLLGSIAFFCFLMKRRPWVHTSLSNSRTNSNSSLRKAASVQVGENCSDLQDMMNADLA